MLVYNKMKFLFLGDCVVNTKYISEVTIKTYPTGQKKDTRYVKIVILGPHLHHIKTYDEGTKGFELAEQFVESYNLETPSYEI
jgi:hypothetical protein